MDIGGLRYDLTLYLKLAEQGFIKPCIKLNNDLLNIWRNNTLLQELLALDSEKVNGVTHQSYADLHRSALCYTIIQQDSRGILCGQVCTLGLQVNSLVYFCIVEMVLKPVPHLQFFKPCVIILVCKTILFSCQLIQLVGSNLCLQQLKLFKCLLQNQISYFILITSISPSCVC